MTIQITREEILSRSTMAPWTPRSVEYDMDIDPPVFPYGKDCSAYVTFCWNVAGDYNTETLVSSGLMHEIDPNDLKPGDAVGHCGPGSGGANGHIQLFTGWLNNDPNDNHYYCWQQNGIGLGPHHDLEDWPGNYKAYRYANVVEMSATPETPSLAWPDRLGANDYFGNIAGPERSHGGYYEWEKPYVMAIQARLRGLGYATGPVDGVFGPVTEGAVAAWQRDHYADLTEFYGQVWADDWSRLFGN